MRTLAIVRVLRGKYLMCYDLNQDEATLPELGDEDLVHYNVLEILKYKSGWLPFCTHFIDVDRFAEMCMKCAICGIQICHCFKHVNMIHASDDIKKILHDIPYMPKAEAEAIRNKQIAEICDAWARTNEEWEREHERFEME